MVVAGGDVLVVDDDPDLRESIAEILRLRGYRVRTCSNGKEALAAVEAAAPALLLLDLMMPVIDGWTVLARLRAAATLLPLERVVVMTACDAGAPPDVRTLSKPFAVKELLGVVRDGGLLALSVGAAAAPAARVSSTR
jgi:CheY-like chemotaxis protein